MVLGSPTQISGLVSSPFPKILNEVLNFLSLSSALTAAQIAYKMKYGMSVENNLGIPD